jgi:hypothetical protein
VAVYETAVVTAAITSATARARGEEDDDNPLRSLPSWQSFKPPDLGDRLQGPDAARANAASFERTRDLFRRLAESADDQPFEGREAVHLLREAAGYTPGGDEIATDTTDPEFLDTVGVPADWAERFVRFHGVRHPLDMGEAEVNGGCGARWTVRPKGDAPGVGGPPPRPGVGRANQHARRGWPGRQTNTG